MAGKFIVRIPPDLEKSIRRCLPDVMGLSGLGAIGAGLWGYDPRIASIVVGALLIVLAALMGRRA